MAAKASIALKRRGTADSKQNLLKAIATSVPDQTISGIRGRPFIAEYYRDLSTEDLRANLPDLLAKAALSHLKLAGSRKPGVAKVRVYNPNMHRDGWESDRTVIEIVNDDMPFIVDSVTAAIVRLGRYVALTTHPIFHAVRDQSGKLIKLSVKKTSTGKSHAESMVRFEIGRIPGRADRTHLAASIRESLADVRAAVRDWQKILAKLRQVMDAARNGDIPVPRWRLNESLELLGWLAEDNFTFLGYGEYKLAAAKGGAVLQRAPGSGLGILRKSSGKKTPRILEQKVINEAQSRDLLVITKAGSRSTVHRNVYLDYIGVRIFDTDAKVIGEYRFIGLFTSAAYNQSPRRVPLIREKVRRIFQRSRFNPDSHRGKALMHILDNYPRDELFQGRVAELTKTAIGILDLQERRKVKLFVRRDLYRRYVSCLIFVPRDRFNTRVRKKIERVLERSFDGVIADTEVSISDSVLTRIYTIVWFKPGKARQLKVTQIEKEIADSVVTWQDRLHGELMKRYDEEQAASLFLDYGEAFPAGYIENVAVEQATQHIELAERIRTEASPIEQWLRWTSQDPGQQLNFTVLKPGSPLPLSDVLPVLENFGMNVASERPYQLRLDDGTQIALQIFDLEHPGGQTVDEDTRADRFKKAFSQVISGSVENDGLNRLVWLAAMPWRSVVILRAYCRYIMQTGAPFSQAYMDQVLSSHPEIAGLMTDAFKAQFEPDVTAKERKRRIDACNAALRQALEAISGLDEDRILRAYSNAINATLRTNFFAVDQDGEPLPYLSLKMDPRKILELPEPRPQFTIFVYSPEVEAIHLRGGAIARGGLRWSDRREDFRTEILGLMKAQIVKNALIVPTGAKGGFVVKSASPENPSLRRQQVEHCYVTFIRGMLDLTDNIVDDNIVPPPNVVCRDADDPYLVVAADKGTATFSDLANSVAAEYGFWLGDAFASGGSNGYDHKQMGITARGAWEAVKRHFREFGVDVQNQPFTVAGIGDMSGDVFGNGMLLSKYTRLLAAFNHQHIFLDPDPDQAISFQERQRLFRATNSSWSDYDPRAISAGGGVFDRQVKRIELTPEVRSILGTEQESATPPEIIKLILSMGVDLLWNGGIGTYVKASTESHLDADDRGNDDVRVDANHLQCKVIGEGGNLGLTQAARIEFAQRGGRINTDFVDNSGGVDSSDREVNIKILLNRAHHEGRLTMAARNRLLPTMTDEVAALVLRDNFQQTLAISVAEASAPSRLLEHAELIKLLERNSGMDRTLECLPDEEAIAERQARGEGLTRPELAVLISHAKIHLSAELLQSNVPEDALLAGEVARYFPKRLQTKFGDLIAHHRLSREIISTLIADSVINRMGPTFVLRAQQETGADTGTIARAYSIARQVLDMRSFWAEVEALDNVIPADVEYSLLFQSSRVLRHSCYWFIQNHFDDLDIAINIERLRPGVNSLMNSFDKILAGVPKQRFEELTRRYQNLGVPTQVAQRMASLMGSTMVLDVVELAAESGQKVSHVGEVYLEISQGLSIGWLRERIENLEVSGRWAATARSRLREGLLAVHRQLTANLLRRGTSQPGTTLVLDWLAQQGPQIQRTKQTLLDIRGQIDIDFPALTVAVRELQQLADS